MEPTTTALLTDALRLAADAHHFHEAAHGSDPDWPPWYADHMARTLGEDGYQLCRTSPR